jgi:hypothetical protein
VIVKQWTIQKDKDSWEQTVPLGPLLPGSYVLQVQGKTFRQSIRFIKNNAPAGPELPTHGVLKKFPPTCFAKVKPHITHCTAVSL